MNETLPQLRIEKIFRQKGEIREALITSSMAIIACCFLAFLLWFLPPKSKEVITIIILCIIIVLLFIRTVISDLLEYRRAIRLDEEGIAAYLELKDKYSAEISPQDSGNLINLFIQYKVYYLEYFLPNGIYCTCLVSKDEYDDAVVHDRIKVRYLIDFPDIQRIESLNENG